MFEIFLKLEQHPTPSLIARKLWDGSFEHPKHMFKLMGKKIITILRLIKNVLNLPYVEHCIWVEGWNRISYGEFIGYQ